MTTDFLRIGHRGAAAYATENTLSSIQAALNCKVDMVEVDVRRSKDGVLVLSHDPYIRTESARARIKRSTYEQLLRLCLPGGEVVTTLEEALRFLRGRALVNIDLKESGFEAEAVAMVTRLQMQDQVMFSSLSIKSLKRVKQQNPELYTVLSFPTSLLIRLYYVNLLHRFWRWLAHQRLAVSLVNLFVRTILPYRLRLLGAGRGDIDAMIIRAPFISDKLIDLARKRELKLYVFPVDMPHEVAKLRQMGVDGIESNRPDVLHVTSQEPRHLAHS